MANTERLPEDLLAILNAPCQPLPSELVEKLNEALNAGLQELAEEE